MTGESDARTRGVFSASSVLQRTFAVWSANFFTFAGFALLVQSPGVIATAVFGEPTPTDGAATAGARLAAYAVSSLFGLIVAGAIAHGVSESMAGRAVTLDGMWRIAVRKGWPILAASLGIGLAVMLGALLLVLPAFVAYCALWVAVPAIAMEPELALLDAFRRSRALTRGHRLSISVVLLALLGVCALTGGVSRILVGVVLGAIEPTGHLMIVQVLSVLGGTLWSVAPAVAYRDLRLADQSQDARLAKVFE